MRILIWCLTVFVVGGVVGGFVSKAEFSGVKEKFEPHNGVSQHERQAELANAKLEARKGLEPTTGAKVEVTNGATHDFGFLEAGEKGAHTFLIRNTGTKLLKLESGGTSCQSCTISQLERKEVPPGEGTEVAVNWSVASPDPEYRKEAYILTNDPEHPTVILVVKGKVVKSIRLEDEEIKLGAVSVTQGRTGKCRVYCFRNDKFEVLSSSLTNDESAAQFAIDVRPLTSEELATREGALQGYEVTATAKPGLPLGGILQTIRLETNWETAKTIDIPVRGNVVSDVSIIGGRNFDPQGNVFRLDVVPRNEGKKVQAQIAVKGPERHDVKFEVGEIDPEGTLKVTLGEPKEINGGAVVLVPITIEVPAGSPPVSRLGGGDRKDYGRILIKTTHSTSKELQLLVRFAVE